MLQQPLEPAAPGNDYPPLAKHMPEISASERFFHPGINPGFALCRCLFGRAVAPGSAVGVKLPVEHVKHERGLTWTGVVLGNGIPAQPFTLVMDAKRARVIRSCFGLFKASAHSFSLYTCVENPTGERALDHATILLR
jgi:hypothetical protein